MLWKSFLKKIKIKDLRDLTLPGGKKSRVIALLLLALVGLYFAGGSDVIMNIADGLQGNDGQDQTITQSAEEKELTDFTSVVLADTEDTWSTIFTGLGGTYKKPNLILFSGKVEPACDFTQAATGPFYCAAEKQVYIDLSFYQDLKNQFDAPGDFAQAYVIAHVIGHHVQKSFGITTKVNQAREQLSTREFNKISIKVELQADCFAGLWAHHADKIRNIVAPGDVADALNAASKIGDDKLEQESQGYIRPDSFTHGSSAQRIRWFTKGYESGILESCDTFTNRKL